MPEMRSTDQPEELAPTRDNLAPRPWALNLLEGRAGGDERAAPRQSPPARAIRPISNDCNARCAPRRPLPARIRPSRGSNLFSLSAIREDMRWPETLLKYLASERRKSAVPCVGYAAKSLGGARRRQTVSRKKDVQTKT